MLPVFEVPFVIVPRPELRSFVDRLGVESRSVVAPTFTITRVWIVPMPPRHHDYPGKGDEVFEVLKLLDLAHCLHRLEVDFADAPHHRDAVRAAVFEGTPTIATFDRWWTLQCDRAGRA